jgi:UDP-2,3-diacylglucosamine hydrolase
MSETFFIADLHLNPKHPIPFSQLLKFLQNRAQQADALYILGDLFEVYLGDDEDQQALKALNDLTNNGVPVFIMHGNRDFLLSQAAIKNCKLLNDDAYVIDLYGVPSLIMHGDTLCTLDVKYQTFRKQVRNPQWQKQFLAQPLAQRRLIAQQARSESQATTKTTAEFIMDVTPEAVISSLEKYNVYQLIHGHTHRPAIHNITVNGHDATRYVLGDWRENSAMILHCTANGNNLIDLYELNSIN